MPEKLEHLQCGKKVNGRNQFERGAYPVSVPISTSQDCKKTARSRSYLGTTGR